MTLQGLIKAGFKATQTRGGRVLTPVVMGAIVGVSMWAGMAEGSAVATVTGNCSCAYTVIYISGLPKPDSVTKTVTRTCEGTFDITSPPNYGFSCVTRVGEVYVFGGIQWEFGNVTMIVS